jgi:hypothetical protein
MKLKDQKIGALDSATIDEGGREGLRLALRGCNFESMGSCCAHAILVQTM